MIEWLRNRFRRGGDYRRFLLTSLPTNSVGCELGIWKGDFSREIIKVVHPRFLYLVDPWLYQPQYPSTWYGGGEARSQLAMDAICEGVRKTFGHRKDVCIIRKKTEDIGEEIPERSLDWVYIDGNHQYELIRFDLEFFLSRVKPGGIICGDDYGRGGTDEAASPVSRAVIEFVSSPHPVHLEWTREHQYFIRVG